MSVTVPVAMNLEGRYPFRWGFANPFKRNHCCVSAWTHLANGTSEDALRLAERARAAGLLSARGYAHASQSSQWAALVGLRVVRSAHAERPTTLTTFAKLNRRGRFLVRVRGHVVAVIEGRIFGNWAPRSRVTYYAEVEG